jgi:Tfp pilus assembly protein FimT
MKNFTYKRASTMMELIFVIVIIGILAATLLPRINQNKPIHRAAIGLVSDIRYLQHLAMQNDLLDPSDSSWFQKRWQIKFSKTVGSDNQWAYALFKDNSVDGNPNDSEVAVNPLNRSKILTGGYSTGTTAYGDDIATKRLNIGHKYGVTSVTMTGGCSIANDGKKRIAFDYAGRPLYGPLHDSSVTKPYQSSFLVQSTCKITLSNGTDSVEISIEPETGYTHITSY